MSLWDDWSALSGDDLLQRMYDVLGLVGVTLVATIIFELFSLETVQLVWKQPGGPKLYVQAVVLNVFNHLVLGVPLYAVAASLLCSSKQPLSILRGAIEVVWVIVVHNVLYYTIHKAFHESPRLYKLHRFHHLFNTHVPPSSANAVNPGEYIIAYMGPFVIPLLFRPTQAVSLKIATGIISLTNLMVHTPKLETLSMKWVPEFLVSTNNHLDHHRKLRAHYASPIINMDNIIRYFTPKKNETKEN